MLSSVFRKKLGFPVLGSSSGFSVRLAAGADSISADIELGHYLANLKTTTWETVFAYIVTG